MSPAMPIRREEIHGQQRVPSHTITALGSTGVLVYHEAREDIWVTYQRPPMDAMWQQPAAPVLSSELG